MRLKINARLNIVFAILILFVMVLVKVNRPTHILANTDADIDIYLPIVVNNFDASLGIPLFGVQMYSDTRVGSKYYGALIDSKASWVRVPAQWNLTEPVDTTSDNYNWTSVDNSLAVSANSNINVIATIGQNPSWAAPLLRGPINADSMDDFVEFVAKLVERYDGDGVDDAPGSPVITYWEFYNEPDHGEGGWGDVGNLYADMLQAVYPAVHTANPYAHVVFGGIAYDAFYEYGGPFNRQFLHDVLDNNGGDYFDVMNFHSYPAFNKTWTSDDGPGLIQKTEVIRAELAAYGHGDRSIVITESGWHSDNSPTSSPAIQAHYVIELFTQSMAANIDVMMWWMLYDPGSGYWLNGLVSNATPPVERSAMAAYQTIVSELSTAHFKRTWTTAEAGSINTEVHEFDDFVHQRTVYVAWLNPVTTDQTKYITIAGNRATIVKVNGMTVVREDVSGVSGILTIPVTAQPIFVEVDK